MYTIQSPLFSILIDPEKGRFDILLTDSRFASMRDIGLSVIYRCQGKSYTALGDTWKVSGQQQKTYHNQEHGEIEEIELQIAEDERGIEFEINLAVMQEYPLVLWKVRVINHNEKAIGLERINLLKIDSSISSKSGFFGNPKQNELGIFFNGWQSWSPSRWYRGDSKMNISRLGFFQHPMIYNPETPLPRKRGLFSSDMFAAIGESVNRTGFLIGFLSQKQHFGSILANFNTGSLQMWANGDDARLDPGCSIETDWAVFNPILLDHRDPMHEYTQAVARQNHARPDSDSFLGWCSWYHFYTRVTAEDIKRNLDSILEQQENLPIQLVQIDDGFESQVGDWFTFKKTFPSGVTELAEDIRGEGLIPGLWLAPFIIHPRSQLIKEHPDWILKGKNGRPVNAGFVWNALPTSLDLTVPEALDHAAKVVRTAALEWGFPYLKLDFLYAAALNCVYRDRTKTRAQVMQMGMDAIRTAVGEDTILLGCGAPLGSMVGYVDAMRIGPDVSGDWKPKFNRIEAIFEHEPGMPSARNSICNILARSNLHRQWWVNDPDCLLVRPDSNLTLAEVQSLATTIGLTGGYVLLSDDLPRLPGERLRIAESLFPILDERARVIDWFDSQMPTRLRLDLVNETGEWHVLAGFNWKDTSQDLIYSPKDFQLGDGNYFSREFWRGEIQEFSSSTPLKYSSVPPHGCVLIAARHINHEIPTYLGSDLHFSQGVEVSSWKFEGGSLSCFFRLPRRTGGKAYFHIPQGFHEARLNGVPAELKSVGHQLYEIEIMIDGFANLEIKQK